MQRSSWLCAVSVVVIILTCASWQARAAVISIDFGGEWLKVALVKVIITSLYDCLTVMVCLILQPGVPMEIVLNK